MSEEPEPPAPVTLSGRAVVISGGPAAGRKPLLAGALHYFRVEPRRWARCLASMRALGFTFVDTMVPWSVHERGPGRFDWSGARDLGAFLDACAGEGLGVLARIGPLCGGELHAGGLPDRILGDSAMLQRNNHGAPSFVLEPPRGWPMPSYASPKFLAEVAALYRAIGEVIAPRLAPHGAVALLQLDHELGGFLRAGPFCADYHPAMVARFAEEHGGMEPPRRFPRPTPAHPEALAPLLAWLAFRERQTLRALADLSALADAAGMARSVAGVAGSPAPAGALRLHGFPALPPVVWDAAAAERVVDVCTAAILDGAADHARTATRARYLAGSSRFPVCAPLALGTFAWGPPRTTVDAPAALIGALMHGAVGYSGAMAVARDRWIGAPIDEQGEPVPAVAEPLGRIHHALARAGWADGDDVLVEDRPDGAAPLGLLVPRDYLRLDLASSLLGPLAPLAPWLRMERAAARADSFGFEGPIQREHHDVSAALVAAMQHAGLRFVLVDASCSAERLARLGGLVVVTFDFLDVELGARLRRYAEGGGRLLWGPRAPRLDAALQHAEAALPGARFDAALLGDRDRLVAALRELAGEAARARASDGATSATSEADGAPSATSEADSAHSATSEAAADDVVVLRRGGAPALIFIGPERPAPAAPPREGRPGHTHRAPHATQPRQRVHVAGLGAVRLIDVVTGEQLAPGTSEIPRNGTPRLLVAEAWTVAPESRSEPEPEAAAESASAPGSASTSASAPEADPSLESEPARDSAERAEPEVRS